MLLASHLFIVDDIVLALTDVTLFVDEQLSDQLYQDLRSSL